MQTSEKQHPLLGQTAKQPAIDHAISDRVVAPLASFDTIDLGDDDLTPTDTGSIVPSEACQSQSAKADITANHVTRPSHLSSLNPAFPLESQTVSLHNDESDPELTPTTSEQCSVSRTCLAQPGCASETAACDSSPAASQPCGSGLELQDKAAVTCAEAGLNADLMSCAKKPEADIKAKENKDPKKQRKRVNSSSSSEFSDEESGKGGVSWSRRVHIYGKISGTSPNPSSPGLPRPPAKQPLPKDTPEETVEIIDFNKASASKKKAYLKKLQRLQVKTNPIERPRSTTPINVFTLEEYVQYSSPEASPSANKIKIKLPDEEYSPRNAERDTLCFNFNEEDLFSHTKSGILMTQDVKSPAQQPHSPRRVLIPPSLTPTTSPNRSAASSPRSPRYIYCPSTNTHFQYPGEPTTENPEPVSSLVTSNWVRFDDSSGAVKAARQLPQIPSQTNASNENSTPQETEEVIQVSVVETGNDKRDCSITILEQQQKSEEVSCAVDVAPVLESNVPDVASAIAAALDSVDGGTDLSSVNNIPPMNEPSNNQVSPH